MSVGFHRLRQASWLLALGGACISVHAGELQAIRVSAGPETTRVVLDLSAAADHRVFELANPDRLVVDLPHTAAASSLQLPEARGGIASVRTGSRPKGELRVVLDLTRRVQSKSFLLPPEGAYGHRLVIDLEPAGRAATVRRHTESTPERGRDLIVAIDAGHGGKDPGASGPKGVREKDVVLQIAKQLAARLEGQAGLRPLLIRNGDYFVSLSDRVRIAREAEADLFISIHADSYRDASARGATVYALSTRRATDEVARRLAERENASELIGGVSIADKDDVLARVLLDLSQSASISASMVAGERVIEQMSAVTRMRKADVQQGSFLVLTSPDIPSVFVETAYISNPREESSLRDPEYQRTLADAIYRGILNYFRSNAPPETYLAMNPPPVPRAPIRHAVERGETLSEIAERYRVSLRTLRRTNQLSSDVIRIGQVLTIPATG